MNPCLHTGISLETHYRRFLSVGIFMVRACELLATLVVPRRFAPRGPYPGAWRWALGLRGPRILAENAAAFSAAANIKGSRTGRPPG